MLQHVNEDKNVVNILLLGDVDAGKSTIAGNLFHRLGINNDIDQNFQFEIDQYHFALENFKNLCEKGERNQESFLKFKIDKNIFQFVDVPGHKDFIKNLLTGQSCAELGILVISAVPGQFEFCISQQGATKCQIDLTNHLGIKQLICLINKMDENDVNFSQDRYEHIKQQIEQCLNVAGYNHEVIPFIPISAKNGDNIYNYSTNMIWYKGFTLLEALNDLKQSKNLIDQPLRLPINEVYQIGGVGVVPFGRIQSGSLKPGMTVLFTPSNIVSEVKQFETTCHNNEAVAGDYIGFSLLKQMQIKDLKRGQICSDAKKNPARECTLFDAYIVLFDTDQHIKQGQTVNIFCHTAKVIVQFEKIYCKINKRTGKIVEQEPKVLKQGDAALVQISPKQEVSVDLFSRFPFLGRFVIKNLRQIIAAGIVIKIENLQQKNQ